MVCTNCGEVNPGGARFCAECGAALQIQPVPLHEGRKTVTIVFSDLVGSTKLGEQRDPETIREVLDLYFSRMKAVLESHGGLVEKYIGDAIVAVFGLPRAHEDDALRATRAASEMGKTLEELNGELQHRWGIILSARTGVNTGEVVVGDPSSGQRLATGDAVNVAARLEQAAPAGQVLIGELTYRLVRDAIEVEAIEGLTLKGKSERVGAYRLVVVTPSPHGVARRLDAPLIGRAKEMAAVLRLFEDAVTSRACRVVTVIADPGVGKSRLLAEIQASLTDRATVVDGRCLSYGEGITFWPIAEIVRKVASVTERESSAEALAKLLNTLPGDPLGPEISRRIASVIGWSQEPASLEESFWAIRKLFEAWARERPLVVLLEDIHWAAETLLDLIENVAELSSDSPILLVCAARPELLEARPGWIAVKANARTLHLGPLTPTDVSSLVNNLLGGRIENRRALEALERTAQGNPLFIEQILSMWVDDGLLERQGDHWSLTGDLGGEAIPPDLSALLSARLDRLPTKERVVLAQAAVTGEVFYQGALSELSSSDPEELRDTLVALTGKRLIRPDESKLADERAYAFRHILIRDTAYESILKRTRADLHEQFAGWLERVVRDRATEYEEILGYHFEQACLYHRTLDQADEPASTLGDRAASFLGSAGNNAFERGDMAAAVNLLGRTAGLLRDGDARKLELAVPLSKASFETGRFDECDRIIAEGVSLAAELGTRGPAARLGLVSLELQRAQSPEGWVVKAQQQIPSLVRALEDADDDEGLGEAWALHAHTHVGSSIVSVEHDMRRALRHAEAAGRRKQAAFIRSLLTGVALHGPTPAPEAILLCNDTLEKVRGELMAEANVRWNLGCAYALTGDFERARKLVRLGADNFDQLGMRAQGAAGRAQRLGQTELLARDYVSAERCLTEGCRVLEELGERFWAASLYGMLAQALYAMSRYDEALRVIDKAAEVTASDDTDALSLYLGVQAKLLARSGQAKQADTISSDAVAAAFSVVGGIEGQANTLMDRVEVLRLANRREEAHLLLLDAIELYEIKGNVVSAHVAYGQLKQLSP